MIQCRAISNGVVIKNNGVIVPCCVFKPDLSWSQSMTVEQIKTVENYFQTAQLGNLRDNLKNDIADSRCSQCWDLEKTGSSSWRKICNMQLPLASEGEQMLVEIRLGNVCNFRCYTCFPTGSSKIQQDWTKINDNRLFREIEVNDWTKDSDNVSLANDFLSRARRISLMGGEPFVNKKIWEYLEPLRSRTDISEISITTNGSVLELDKLEGLPNLLLNFSIDAVGPLSEYVRLGSDWNIVRNNLEASIQNNVRTNVSITISVYNIFALPKTLEYLTNVSPNYIHFNFVTDPDFLAIDNLHPSLVNQAKEILFKMGNDQNIKHAMSIVGSKYTETNFEKFLEYTKKLDNLRGVSLVDCVPEFKLLF